MSEQLQDMLDEVTVVAERKERVTSDLATQLELQKRKVVDALRAGHSTGNVYRDFSIAVGQGQEDEYCAQHTKSLVAALNDNVGKPVLTTVDITRGGTLSHYLIAGVITQPTKLSIGTGVESDHVYEREPVIRVPMEYTLTRLVLHSGQDSASESQKSHAYETDPQFSQLNWKPKVGDLIVPASNMFVVQDNGAIDRRTNMEFHIGEAVEGAMNQLGGFLYAEFLHCTGYNL